MKLGNASFTFLPLCVITGAAVPTDVLKGMSSSEQAMPLVKRATACCSALETRQCILLIEPLQSMLWKLLQAS